MIPKRIHRDLPGDSQWIITERWIPEENRVRPVVYLANDIRPDSPLEQHFVRQAIRAWRKRHYPGPLIVIPVTAAGGAWAARKLRQPVAATGVVVGAAMVAAAAVAALSGPDIQPQHHGPLAIAPPVDPTARLPERIPRPYKPAPQQSTGPDRPGSSTPRPAPSGPRPRAGGDVLAAGSGGSSGPGKPEPGKPPVPQPPSAPPPEPPPPAAAGCRLVEVNVGHLVRICL
jgi:hypothetical protein